jgi:23S rRNA pseudouridine1911/1915/1917 synthase
MKCKSPKTPIRLDTHLTQTLSQNRATVQQWIKDGDVLVNGLPTKPSARIESKDTISLKEDLITSKKTALDPYPYTLDLLYEDTDVLVLNKPVDLAVHPTQFGYEKTLANILVHYHPPIASIGDHPIRPGIVHRLDKNTEGLMVIAKTQHAFEHLKTQFKTKQIHKRYLALVQGNVLSDHHLIHNHLDQTSSGLKKIKIVSPPTPTSKEAITSISVIKRFGSQTLIEAIPKTGRTHQIRVHLAGIGHPILGDSMYNKEYHYKANSVQKLQAVELGFIHPSTGQKLYFKRPSTLTSTP